MVTEVREVEEENAYEPMAVTEVGMEMVMILEHPENAKLGMYVS